MEQSVRIEINSDELDEAMKKANRLVELLQEARQIIDSLSSEEKSET